MNFSHGFCPRMWFISQWFMIPRLFFRISFILTNHLIPLKRGKNITIGCWNLLWVGQKLIQCWSLLQGRMMLRLHGGSTYIVDILTLFLCNAKKWSYCQRLMRVKRRCYKTHKLYSKTSVSTPFRWCPSSSISLPTRRKPLYSPQPPPTACLSLSLNTFAGSPRKEAQAISAGLTETSQQDFTRNTHKHTDRHH